jgi:hypothetical protein
MAHAAPVVEELPPTESRETTEIPVARHAADTTTKVENGTDVSS